MPAPCPVAGFGAVRRVFAGLRWVQLTFGMPFIRVGERDWMGGNQAGFLGAYSLLDSIGLKCIHEHMWVLRRIEIFFGWVFLEIGRV